MLARPWASRQVPVPRPGQTHGVVLSSRGRTAREATCWISSGVAHRRAGGPECELVIADKAVSRCYWLDPLTDGLWVRDLGSPAPS